MKTTSGQSVFIVDDDTAFADSLAVLLNVKGYQTKIYESGINFLETHDRRSSGCVLLDVRMPDINGLDLLKRLNANRSPLSVIVLTGHGDIPTAVMAMQTGAVDFLEKPLDKELLYATIDRVMAKIKSAADKAAKLNEMRTLIDRLSPREREVFEFLIKGQSNKDIAAKLNISPRTVEMHRSHLMLKMRSNNLSDLIRVGLAIGVIPLSL